MDQTSIDDIVRQSKRENTGKKDAERKEDGSFLPLYPLYPIGHPFNTLF